MTTPRDISIMRDGPARSLALAIVNVLCDALATDAGPGLGLTSGQVQALEDGMAALFGHDLSPAQADALTELILSVEVTP